MKTLAKVCVLVLGLLRVSLLSGEGGIETGFIRKIYSVLLMSAIGRDNWAGTRVKAVLNRVTRPVRSDF